MAHKRFPGIPTAINGKLYLVPAIALRQHQDHSPVIEQLLRGDWATDPRQFFKNGMPLILLAIQRNYPDITADELEDWLDLVTFRCSLLAALGRSGKAEQPPPEDHPKHMTIKAKQDAVLRKQGFIRSDAPPLNVNAIPSYADEPIDAKPGIPFLMRGQIYKMPSLSLGALQEHHALLTDPISATSASEISNLIDRALPVILLALKQNYPKLRKRDLRTELDYNSFRQALLLLQAATGLKIAGSGNTSGSADIDWDWIYTTIVRVTGWTFETCAAQPAASIFALIDSFTDFPPEHILLAAVHGVKSKATETPSSTMSPEDMHAMQSIMGPAQPIPDHIRELIAWADSFGKTETEAPGTHGHAN